MSRTTSAALAAALLVSVVGLSSCVGTPTKEAGDVSLPPADMAAAQRLVSADETLQVLSFPAAGSVMVSGVVDGYKSPAYLVPAAAGQSLALVLSSRSPNAYFNVHDAADSSGQALFNGNTGERTATLTAARAMTFVIRPFQPRASARRGERVPYDLEVARR